MAMNTPGMRSRNVEKSSPPMVRTSCRTFASPTTLTAAARANAHIAGSLKVGLLPRS
jgi:hypothetical protein